MKTKLLSLLLALLLCIGAAAIPAAAATTASGSFGSLTWTLTNDGTLTISGTGEMPRGTSNLTPWYDYRTKIKSVIIEPGVTSITWYAFSGSYLNNVSIPDTVTFIDEQAFSSCHSLTSVTLPDSVTKLGICVFQNCGNLTDVKLSAGLTELPYATFSGCASLTDITIPAGVASIGANAFSYCYSLGSISIPAGVTSIGRSAFDGCTGLTGISIPSSVTSIGQDAFLRCSALTIYGVSGSAAEQFAGKNSIAFSTASMPGASAPVDPAPVDPAPVDPAPVDPAPVEPAPDAPATPVPGTPIGDVLYTDIVAYIDGAPVRSYNIAGNTYIVIEDLVGFGFGVQWLSDPVQYPNGVLIATIDPAVKPEAYTSTYVPEANTNTPGSVAMPYLYTNIQTYLGETAVTGYNIGGFTCIGMDDLAAYCSSGYVWDAANLALRLETGR